MPFFVFAWMLLLHIAAFASNRVLVADISRVKALSELSSINLGDFVPAPGIELKPFWMETTQLTDEVRKQREFPDFVALQDLMTAGESEKAYLEAAKLALKVTKTPLEEWVLALKADALYQVQKSKAEPKLTFVVDEYQEVMRRFPLHPEGARFVYQLALLQMDLEFYDEVDVIVDRGLKEFPRSEFAPRYLLLRAEKSFRINQMKRALTEFTLVIDQYPQSSSAIQAAFRKAFLQFKAGDFRLALRTYEQVENFHSGEFKRLREGDEATEASKLLDRAFYAETLFLNSSYDLASEIFQNLANRFPESEAAPFLLIRFADTYFQRGRFQAAERLYQSIASQSSYSRQARSWADVKRAQLYFVSGDVRAHREFTELAERAFERMGKGEHPALSAYILAQLAAYHLYFQSYPRAQEVLKRSLVLFPENRNQSWIANRWIETIEFEISDYFDREDDLAVLATYFVAEGQKVQAIKNTRVLFAVAESARRLGLVQKTGEVLNRIIYLEKSAEARQDAILKLAAIQVQEKEFRKAAERLRRFQFAYPRTKLQAQSKKLWGDIYSGLGNRSKAIDYYEQAFSAAAVSPAVLFEIRHAWMTLADHYQQEKLPLKAIDVYQNFIQFIGQYDSRPTAGYRVTSKDLHLVKVARYRIADLYFEMNDFVRALDAYRSVAQSIKDEPFLSHARYRIGESYLRLGDSDSALVAFKEMGESKSDSLWAKAAASYIATVELEKKYGLKILN
jgi:tetratricopeptide (TPR) repeat protein